MDGKYAFLMESKAIQYMIERNCKLHQVGGNLDNKGYGIPMKPDSPYKPLIDGKLVELQEGGVFHRLTVKWWKQKRGGGACVGGEAAGGVAELGMPNVVGVFVFTVGYMWVNIQISLVSLTNYTACKGGGVPGGRAARHLRVLQGGEGAGGGAGHLVGPRDQVRHDLRTPVSRQHQGVYKPALPTGIIW